MKRLKSTFSFPSLGHDPGLDNTIIGIGASTGGTETVLEVLRMLPEDMPGMIIVQHMPPEGEFTARYAQRLNRLCKMQVREARHGDVIKRGCAYIAPANHHTRIVKYNNRYILTCEQDDKINGHRPSVDALFYSMAKNVTCKMIGIIMTGMGKDGANGLLAMRQKGAYTIGQDQQSSVVYGMPLEAHKIGAVAVQVPYTGIAGVLYQHLQSHK